MKNIEKGLQDLLKIIDEEVDKRVEAKILLNKNNEAAIKDLLKDEAASAKIRKSWPLINTSLWVNQVHNRVVDFDTMYWNSFFTFAQQQAIKRDAEAIARKMQDRAIKKSISIMQEPLLVVNLHDEFEERIPSFLLPEYVNNTVHEYKYRDKAFETTLCSYAGFSVTCKYKNRFSINRSRQVDRLAGLYTGWLGKRAIMPVLLNTTPSYMKIETLLDKENGYHVHVKNNLEYGVHGIGHKVENGVYSVKDKPLLYNEKDLEDLTYQEYYMLFVFPSHEANQISNPATKGGKYESNVERMNRLTNSLYFAKEGEFSKVAFDVLNEEIKS